MSQVMESYAVKIRFSGYSGKGVGQNTRINGLAFLTHGKAILNLINALEVYCIQVISYQESWTETLGEIGEILYAITGWVDRMECKRRSERTKVGLDRAIRQGKKSGRPKSNRDKKKSRKRTARIYT